VTTELAPAAGDVEAWRWNAFRGYAGRIGRRSGRRKLHNARNDVGDMLA
jgi:hypothetical protein